MAGGREGGREGWKRPNERTNTLVTAKVAAQSPLLFPAKKHAFGIPRAAAATLLRVAR